MNRGKAALTGVVVVAIVGWVLVLGPGKRSSIDGHPSPALHAQMTERTPMQEGSLATRNGTRPSDDPRLAATSRLPTTSGAELGVLEVPEVTQPADTLVGKEQRVMALYSSIAKLYDELGEDCQALGDATGRVVAAEGGALRELTLARSAMPESARPNFDADFETRHAGQLSQVRRVLQTALAECGDEDGFRNAMRTLAALGR